LFWIDAWRASDRATRWALVTFGLGFWLHWWRRSECHPYEKNWYKRTRITPSSRPDVDPPCPPPPRNPQNGDLDLQRSRRLTGSVSPSSLPPPHSATEASHQGLRRSCVHFLEAARTTGGGTFPASGHVSGTRKQVAEVVGQPTSSPPPPASTVRLLRPPPMTLQRIMRSLFHRQSCLY